MAGIMGAMDATGMGQFDPGQMTQAFDVMSGADLGLMGTDAAMSMMNSIGVDQIAIESGDKLSGLLGAMDPTQYGQDVSKETVVQAFDAMGFDQALTMGGDNLAGVLGVMDSSDLAKLDTDQMGQAFDMMAGIDFGLMGAESAAAMMESMGFDHALVGGGEQMAGIMGAMDATGMGQFDPGQMTQAFDTMVAGDIRSFMGADSAIAMLDTVVAGQTAVEAGDKLAGLVGAIDPTQYGHDISKETVLDAFGAMTVDQALTMGGEQLAGVIGIMDTQQVGNMTTEDKAAFTHEMTGQDIQQFMSSDSAFSMFTSFTAEQTTSFQDGQLGGMFGAMDADKITEIASFGGEVLSGAVGTMPGTDFQNVGSDSAMAIYDNMADKIGNLEGEQVAGLLGAMDHDQITQNIDSSQVFDLASSIQATDWGLVGGDSTVAMMEGMGVSQVVELEGTQVAGMVNNLDADQFQSLGAEQVGQIASALEGDQLAGLSNEAAVGMGTTMTADQFGQLDSDQLMGMTTAIDATGIGDLSGDVLEVIAENLEVSEINTLDNDLAGGLFGGVSDETIGLFDTERVDGMLDALNADFLGAGGADFDSISGGNTAFDQLSFASPDVLQSVVGDHAESIFGGSLFGV